MSQPQIQAVSQEAAELKSRVISHWEEEACGTRYGSSDSPRQYFDEIERARYTLEPYIVEFAEFASGRGKRVLEIGVGCGADFHHWLRNGAMATGIDLTETAIRLTRQRLDANHVPPSAYELHVADAEDLPFDANQFDIVYSYGVLHHSPNTELAFREAYRVLKPGGTLKAMIYHIPSWTGWLLWLHSCLLRGTPRRSVRQAIFRHLESPGTKAYTLAEARELLSRVGFDRVKLDTRLAPGDLLTIKLSRKYRSPLFQLASMLYPRWLVTMMGDRYGLSLLIEAQKGAPAAIWPPHP